MKIRVECLGEEPFEWQEQLDVTKDELGHPELLELSGVGCRGRVTAASPGFLLQASLSYEQTLRCIRCLQPALVPAESELSLLLVLEEPAAVDVDHELEEEELGVVFLREPFLDTRPLVVEQLQLGMPMKPVCRKACAGLCASCGADLNQGACDCAVVSDSRWSALRELKSRLNEED